MLLSLLAYSIPSKITRNSQGCKVQICMCVVFAKVSETASRKDLTYQVIRLGLHKIDIIVQHQVTM